MTWITITFALVALGVGVWIGLGAPGWPRKPMQRRRKLEKRPINPIAWRRGDVERGSRRRR
jgi:hypothetical protein